MSWHIIGEAMSLVTWWSFRDRVLSKLRRRPGALPKAAPAAAQTPAQTPESD
jgi:hypothetical protein